VCHAHVCYLYAMCLTLSLTLRYINLSLGIYLKQEFRVCCLILYFCMMKLPCFHCNYVMKLTGWTFASNLFLQFPSYKSHHAHYIFLNGIVYLSHRILNHMIFISHVHMSRISRKLSVMRGSIYPYHFIFTLPVERVALYSLNEIVQQLFQVFYILFIR